MSEKKITLSDIREEALLARMPGRRSLWRRRAPEIWAAVIYAILLVVWLTPELIYRPQSGIGAAPRSAWWLKWGLVSGAYLAYFLAGAVLFFGALASGSLAWARERDRGTLEPLLLTPMNFSAVVSLRFWHGLWPWVRLMLWLLPIYLLISLSGPFLEFAHDPGELHEPWGLSCVCVFMSKPLLGLFAWGGPFKPGPDWHLGTTGLVALRLVNDFSIVLFVCAAAYYLSVRSRSGTRALVAASLIVPLAAPLILAPQDMLGLTAQLLIWADYLTGSNALLQALLVAYGLVGIAAFIARVWLALWLVKRAARNFDWYALGEKPPAP
jgi:hypothetical protein